MKKFDLSKVRMCLDRYPDSPEDLQRAARLARQENPVNAPVILPGVDLMPVELALLTSAKWSAGRVLRIAFMDGAAAQKAEVRAQAEVWLPFVNLSYLWDVPVKTADIRISFQQKGAWSLIGTDALSVPSNQPTMNFGFLQPGTATHEFGHALGCIHEHQSPGAGVIPWIVSRVYQYYGGPPNSWSRATIDQNILAHYNQERTQFTAWDKGSIMEYPIDPQLVSDPAYAVGWNTALSPVDQQYIASVYPRAIAPPPPPPPPPLSVRREVLISFIKGQGTVTIDGAAV